MPIFVVLLVQTICLINYHFHLSLSSQLQASFSCRCSTAVDVVLQYCTVWFIILPIVLPSVLTVERGTSTMLIICEHFIESSHDSYHTTSVFCCFLVADRGTKVAPLWENKHSGGHWPSTQLLIDSSSYQATPDIPTPTLITLSWTWCRVVRDKDIIEYSIHSIDAESNSQFKEILSVLFWYYR